MNFPTSTLANLALPLNLVGLVVCPLVILIMLFRRSDGMRGRGLLLFSFLTILYPLLIVRLHGTGAIYQYPHLLRTSAPVGLLYMPTMYLYVQTLATGRPLRWSDALHLLPAGLFVVDFLPFYGLSAEAKRQLVLGSQYWQQFLRFDEGWLLPAYSHHYIRSLHLVIYWLLSVRIIYGLYRCRETDFRQKNRVWFNWMVNLTALQALLFMPAAGVTLFDWDGTTAKFWYDVVLTLLVLLMCFTLLLRPEILYGLQYGAAPAPAVSSPPKEQPQPPRPSPERLEHYIPESLIVAYDRRIQQFMKTQEAFLKPGYTIREMAESMDVPLHHLSAVINRHYGYHFNEYINHWRIEYLKQRLDKHEWKHKTLEALAQESGFTNRTSFITAFKKQYGTTPSDYVKRIKTTA